MKKTVLTLIATLVCTVGAWAYSTSDLTSAGWTQVTNLGSFNVSDYYFVFVDAENTSKVLLISNPTSYDPPCYAPMSNPFAASHEVWKLVDTGSGTYNIQSYCDNRYFVSGWAGWDHSMQDNTGNGDFTFTLSDGKYKIHRHLGAGWEGYVGHWGMDADKLAYPDYIVDSSDEKLLVIEKNGANKGEDAPGFYLYSISRTAYETGRRNGAKLATEGWTQVTSTAGLGLPGYYYVFLDVSEFGYESGLALTTNLTYTSLSDPITNPAQLWVTEAYNESYALKSAETNKYFSVWGYDIWSGWAVDMWENHGGDGRSDFTFTLNDGKWKLHNNFCGDGTYVGRYGGFYHPYEGEGIGANKGPKNENRGSGGMKQYLIYSIPTIEGVATPLGEGNMVADQWYYIDIAEASSKYVATATTLGDIVYTTAGNTLVRDVADSHFAAINNSLSATRYYVKSSTVNHLELEIGVDVNMKVTAAAQYATFVAPFDVTIPSGVTAYTVPNLSGNRLNLSPVSTTIPAGTPVILSVSRGLMKPFLARVLLAHVPKGF